MNEDTPKTTNEIPYAELQEVEKRFPDGVTVRVMRRDFRGRFGAIGGIADLHKQVRELATPETWLFDLAGGGAYELQLFDPEEPLKMLLRFKVPVEGKEKLPAPKRDGRPHFSSGGGGDFPMQRPVYISGGGGDDDEERARALALYEQSNNREVQRLAKQLDDLKEQNKELAKQLERDRREHDSRLEREREERRIAEQERKELEHEHQMELLRAEIASVKNGSSAMPKIDVVALAAALAPAAAGLMSMVNSGKDRDMKNLELMLGALNKKGGGDDSVKLLTETILPIIKESSQARSPEAMARLVEAMADAQSTSMAQLSQMIHNAASEQPDNPWYQIVDRGVKALTEIAQQMGETVRDGVRPGERQLPADANDPERITDMIMRAPNLPRDLATPQWRSFFKRIHARDNPQQLARDLAEHLEELEQGGRLPDIFRGLFSSEESASTFLERLLTNLPIAQMDAAYVRRFLVAFDDAFSTPDDAEDQEESAEAEIVEPPQQHA